MAKSTGLNRALREIAGALTKYAGVRGWKNDDYWIYYRIDPEWDRVHIIFVAKEFDPSREFDNYVSVREYLGREFAGRPELFDLLGLIVRSSKQVDQGGIYAIGPDYREFWTFYRS